MAIDVISVSSLAQTQRLAAWLATRLEPGDCLLLDGDLGAGKSAFCRAIIQYLAGAAVEVPSPTFTLLQVYELLRLRIYHYDLYRVADADEMWELDWENARSGGVCLIEWPSRLGHLTPPDALKIGIWQKGNTYVENGAATGKSADETDNETARTFRFDADSQHWRNRLQGLWEPINDETGPDVLKHSSENKPESATK